MGNEYQINKEQLGLLNQLVDKLSADQLIWVNGYMTGVLTVKQNTNNRLVPAQSIPSDPISILYGTHTGHSKAIAQDLYDRVKDLGFDVKLQGLDKYKKNQLKKEKYVFLIISTHGEGEPPMQAEDIHEFIQGDRAPNLKDLKYSVLALGDKSYKQYCKTGIDFDQYKGYYQKGKKLKLA
jgi:sulfite reductase (NADPH) flavoprotein alpha-component